MTTDKKLTIKRLIIFLVISFVPFMVIVPIMWAYYGEPIYTSENESVQIANYVLGVFGMMIPSCANLITRLVTREGFRRSYLGLNCKGRMRYFIASVAVPLAYSAAAMLLIWALYLGMSFSDTFETLSLKTVGLLLLQFSFTLVVFFPAFGEEWGWRGYMMPKLLTLMPKPAAVVTGGVIWGLWHAPLTVAGHNFGVDYPGYPWLGILYMCVMCVCLNAFLTLITEKTGSIYPAAFCHAVNNNLGMGVLLSMFGTETAVERLSELSEASMFIPYLGILAVIGAVSMALLPTSSRLPPVRSRGH